MDFRLQRKKKKQKKWPVVVTALLTPVAAIVLTTILVVYKDDIHIPWLDQEHYIPKNGQGTLLQGYSQQRLLPAYLQLVLRRSATGALRRKEIRRNWSTSGITRLKRAEKTQRGTRTRRREDKEVGEEAERKEDREEKEDVERSDDRKEQREKARTEGDTTPEAETDREQHREEPTSRSPHHVPGGTWLHKVPPYLTQPRLRAIQIVVGPTEEESVDMCYAHLRKLQSMCINIDQLKEIWAQLIQACKSVVLRRLILRQPGIFLDDILVLARYHELSNSQAYDMEVVLVRGSNSVGSTCSVKVKEEQVNLIQKLLACPRPSDVPSQGDKCSNCGLEQCIPVNEPFCLWQLLLDEWETEGLSKRDAPCAQWDDVMMTTKRSL
ncbi:hypothetical protein NDU88_009177 [Pleurodeles waltl]|uniref:Uncharacterized protein n=1 Tax=Pleurodeles waltl TaxID=8319 RepID=A0AAV7PS06_PLEWA|nr:hypothetical protein NDU88_009177 [Pleurodeles waltl]